MMDIKKLNKPIEINLEQYECNSCKEKFYINSEDKDITEMQCPFCGEQTINIRIFDIEIKGIGEY